MNKRITKIAAHNLKGQSFIHDLNKITVFCGDNESGKTARFDAILLAQLGYKLKPGQKPMRTPAAIFRSCGCAGGGATELKVENAMNDGTSIRRAWTMKRGKISYDGPDDSYIPQMMLDPSGFFAISGPERRNLVLSQVDLQALGLGEESLKMKLLETLNPLIITESSKLAFNAVCIEVECRETLRQADNESIYDWITKLVNAITTMRDKEASLVTTHEETLRGLTDHKATDNDMTALQSVQPEINAARERHTAAVAAEATALAAFTAAERRHQEAKSLAAKQVDETAVRKQIAEKQAEIEQHQQVPSPGPAPRAKTMTEMRPVDVVCRRELRDLENKAQQASQEQQAAIREVKRLEAEIDAAKHKTNCPTCGQGISHLQAEVIKHLQKQLKVAAGKDVSLTNVLAFAQGNVATAQDRLTAIETAIAAWDEAKAVLDTNNQSALRTYNAKVNSYNGAQRAINDARATIQRLEAGIAANAGAREAWANLPALERASQEAGDAYATARDAVPPIAEQIRQLETSQRQFIARTQNERLANQSRIQLTTATERLAVFKAALKVVSEEKVRAGEEAFNSLLKHARLMTDGNLRAPLEFRDGDLGMTFDGNWIDIGEFSGKQQIFALAGLGLALTQNNQGVRIVLVDELGRLTAMNKWKLIGTLLELIKQGVIDQAVLADVSANDYQSNPDVTVINVDMAGEHA